LSSTSVVLALDAARPTNEMAPRIPITIATIKIPVTVAKTYFRKSFIFQKNGYYDSLLCCKGKKKK
jgi:hypothetical protein